MWRAGLQGPGLHRFEYLLGRRKKTIAIMESRPKAPRLQAFLERRYGPSVFASPRTDWEALGVGSTSVVQIDVGSTPIGRVAQDASKLAAVAHQFGPSRARVSVYRYDQADQPTPWNADHYSVWLDLDQHRDIRNFVNRASTSYDANLVQYLHETVFWVKEQPGDDHWLTDLPSSVVAVVQFRSEST